MSHSLTSSLLASAIILAPFVCAAAEPTAPAINATPTVALPSHVTPEAAQPEALWRVVANGEARLAYKDNIYKAKNDKKGDFISRVLPEVALVSNLDRHALRVSGLLDAAKYASENDNDFVDGKIDATARYDVNDVISINPKASWRDDHVDVGAFEDEPETRNKKPTDYQYGEAGATLDIHPESYLIQLGGMVDYYDFDNTDRLNGTTSINDDRDRTETSEWTKLGYNIRPDLMIYTLGGIDQRSYDTQIDSTRIYGRDSDGKTLRLGTLLGSKTDFKWLDINMGYLGRNYDTNYYTDVDTLGFTIDGFYQVAANWSLELDADRSIEETTLSGVSSYIKTNVRTEVAYHISPTVEVAGNVRYTLNDFQINKSLSMIDREDKVYEAGVNTRYDLNDTYKVDLGYNYTKRTSNNASVEYSGNAVMLTLVAGIN